MTLEAVFLDVGGTLLHEVPSRFTLYARAARECGADVDDAGMQALMRRAHRELPQRVGGAFRYTDAWFAVYIRRIFHGYLGLAESAIEPIRERLFARFEDEKTFRLYPGAFELVDGLRERGLFVGVVSNWSARLPRVLRAVGLDARLDAVLCSATLEQEKPGEAIFRTALERAGVAPEAALHAGDHPVNDGAARRVGIEAVLVDHGGGGPPPPGRDGPLPGPAPGSPPGPTESAGAGPGRAAEAPRGAPRPASDGDLPVVDGLPALGRYVARRLETPAP